MSKFYLITLDSCGHCHTFLDKYWPELIPYITELGYEIHHHDVKYMKQRQWIDNNKHISEYVLWYPTLLIDNGLNIIRYEDDMEDISSIKDWIYHTTM